MQHELLLSESTYRVPENPVRPRSPVPPFVIPLTSVTSVSVTSVSVTPVSVTPGLRPPVPSARHSCSTTQSTTTLGLAFRSSAANAWSMTV